MLRAALIACFCTACVGLFKVTARKPRLEVEPVPAVLTQASLSGGQLLVAAALVRGTPGLQARVELLIDEVVIDSYVTTSAARQLLRWTPPLERNGTHQLRVRGFDGAETLLPGGVAVEVTVANLGPEVTDLYAAPAADAADAIDVTFVLPKNPAAVQLTVGTVTQSIAANLRTARVTGLTAGEEYEITLTVSDELGNVSTKTDRAGPRVWIIGTAPVGVTATGSRNRPFASVTAARVATALLDRVWFSLLPGVFDATNETFPLQLGVGRTLRGSRGRDGSLQSRVVGRGAYGIVAPVLSGCATFVVTGLDASSAPIVLESVAVEPGNATPACSGRPDGVVSVSAHVTLRHLSFTGANHAVLLGGEGFVTHPLIDDVVVRDSIFGIDAAGPVWPRISALDHDSHGLGNSRGLRLAPDVQGDFTNDLYFTLSASRIVTSAVALEAMLGTVGILSAASGARNDIQLSGVDALAPDHAALLVSDTSQIAVCGTDLTLGSDVVRGSIHTLGALVTTTNQTSWLGQAPVDAPADCDVDPLVRITTHGVGDGVIFRNSAGFQIAQLLAQDLGPVATPEPVGSDRNAGLYIVDAPGVTNTTVRDSRITGFDIALQLAPEGASPHVRIVSTCLTPIVAAPPGGDADWSVQLTAADGFVSPRAISDTSYSGLADSSNNKRPINFAVFEPGDFVVDPGDAHCP